LVEEKFNQQNISNLIRNILTLRYDPSQKTTLPILNSQDFLPSNQCDLYFIENSLKNSIQTKLMTTKNLAVSLSGGIDSTLILSLIRKTFPDLKINAISIKFAYSNDETPTAKKIADFFDAEHEIIYIENYLLELPSAISIIGLPFWAGSPMRLSISAPARSLKWCRWPTKSKNWWDSRAISNGTFPSLTAKCTAFWTPTRPVCT